MFLPNHVFEEYFASLDLASVRPSHLQDMAVAVV